MYITISEFAKKRQIKRDTVNAFIRHNSEIKKFTVKKGKNLMIDTSSQGYDFLCKKYPIPEQITENKKISALMQRIQELEYENKHLIQKNKNLQQKYNTTNSLLHCSMMNEYLYAEKYYDELERSLRIKYVLKKIYKTIQKKLSAIYRR